jgi:hypothetical protein
MNNQNQDELAKSKFLKCVNGTDARVVVDLSEAYKENSRRMHRGIEMVDERRAVLVQDEFEIEKPTESRGNDDPRCRGRQGAHRGIVTRRPEAFWRLSVAGRGVATRWRIAGRQRKTGA